MHVLPLFQSPHGHLRAKAAWLAKEFANIEFSNGGAGSGPLFNALLQAVIHSLSDRWVVWLGQVTASATGGWGLGRGSKSVRFEAGRVDSTCTYPLINVPLQALMFRLTHMYSTTSVAETAPAEC
jgi:hypothetical protein